jgi:hypothetical protein
VKRITLLGLCLFLAAPSGWTQSDAQKKATIAYLRDLQGEDGGFQPGGRGGKTELPATSAALRALKYFGGQPRDRAACVAFVKSCFDKEAGGFGEHPDCPSRFRATCTGIMAVVELKIPAEPYFDSVVKYLDANAKTFEEIRLAVAAFESMGKKPPHAEAWLAEIARLRHADGTYGKGDGVARDTGGAVVAVLRLGGKVEHPDVVLKTLNGGQRRDGGFGKEGAAGSDLETTYRVMRAFHMLRAKPEGAERLRAFIARCRNEDGGYGVAPGQPSGTSGTYFAATVLHWLDAK